VTSGSGFPASTVPSLEMRGHVRRGNRPATRVSVRQHDRDPDYTLEAEETLGQLDALGRLQVELLRELVPEPPTGPEPYLKEAIRIAHRHGFEVIGGGSSRIAVPFEDKVAKVAWWEEGLRLNLQEAVVWLAVDPQTRRYFAPCILLAPTFVLLQEHVEVCGPPLTDCLAVSKKRERELATNRDREFERRKVEILELKMAIYPDPPGGSDAEQTARRIHELARGIGISPDPDFKVGSREIRLDNFGIRANGDLVAIDFGEKWEPIEACWEIVLRRLEDGPLPLTTATTEWLEAEMLALSTDPDRARRLRWVTDLDRMAFLSRAGVWPLDTDPCPCGSGATYGECYCANEEECTTSALELTRRLAVFPTPPPMRFRAEAGRARRELPA
jgi:hypothetical protein